ncbi:transmembrane protein [Candidatus Magnetomorum sp. HK-1]|nr:transmembrane protein [Candidatus Magnetomorum sp. HK-1]
MISNRIYKILLFLLICLPALALAQDRAQLIKAGFIAKFVQFTSWPAELSNQSDEFLITIIGKDPIYGVLEKLYKNKKLKNLPIKVKHIYKVEEINNTNVLFISKDMSSELNNIFEKIRNKPIMTVSDTDGFCKKGVLLNFYITNKGTLHFELNSQVMKQTPLKINLLLLEIARVIN